MGNLLNGVVLFATVVTALGLGIMAAYASVLAILHAFNSKRSTPGPVLVVSQSHASGD